MTVSRGPYGQCLSAAVTQNGRPPARITGIARQSWSTGRIGSFRRV